MTKLSKNSGAVILAADEMSKRHERTDAIADDLEAGEQRHRKQRAGDAPHPEPEDEREMTRTGLSSKRRASSSGVTAPSVPCIARYVAAGRKASHSVSNVRRPARKRMATPLSGPRMRM